MEFAEWAIETGWMLTKYVTFPLILLLIGYLVGKRYAEREEDR